MISLIDADAFFASCELARHPHLKGKPVMILGRIGSFVLAKSQEAKESGVTTVMPYWEAKKRCPNGIFIEGDFKFYSQTSRKLMTIVKEWSPLVQVSSIDEAYVDLSGIDQMRQKTFQELGDELREKVKTELGITVTVGISTNKVLAKMACTQKKPDATSVLFKKDIPQFLSQIEIGKIPGIGRQRAKTVAKYGLETAGHMRNLPMTVIKNLFGRNGIMLWKELHGDYMFRVDPTPRIPKQIGRTSSLEKATSDLRQIEGLAFYHLERSLEALHRHQLATQELSLYLRDMNFKRYHLPHPLHEPTDDFLKLSATLRILINQIPKNQFWRSAGVLFTSLSSATVRQLNLFEDVEKQAREERLNRAKDELNKKYGLMTVMSGSNLFLEAKKTSRKVEGGHDLLWGG